MPIFERISEAPVQTLGEVDALAAGPMEVRMRSALERSSVSVAESLDPVRVLHVIPSLKQGGAELMLSGLIRSASPSFGHHVHSLLPANDFFGLDTAVLTSGTGRRGIPSLRMWRELSATLERFRPHLVHAWMYHANLATAVAAAGGGHRVIWSIHNGKIAAGHFKRSNAPRRRALRQAFLARSRSYRVRLQFRARNSRGQRLRPEPRRRHRQWHRPAALPVVEAREAGARCSGSDRAGRTIRSVERPPLPARSGRKPPGARSHPTRIRWPWVRLVGGVATARGARRTGAPMQDSTAR